MRKIHKDIIIPTMHYITYSGSKKDSLVIVIGVG